jgi:hypothetical protein
MSDGKAIAEFFGASNSQVRIGCNLLGSPCRSHGRWPPQVVTPYPPA